MARGELFWFSLAQMVKNLPAMQEARVQSLGQEGPLEKGTATYSSILAWRIPWMEEPGESTVHRGHRESDTTERPTLSLLHSITLTYRFHSETSSQASSPHPQSRIRRPASRSDTRSGSAGLPGSPRHGQVLRVVTDFPDSSSSGSLSWSTNLC